MFLLTHPIWESNGLAVFKMTPFAQREKMRLRDAAQVQETADETGLQLFRVMRLLCAYWWWNVTFSRLKPISNPSQSHGGAGASFIVHFCCCSFDFHNRRIQTIWQDALFIFSKQ
jgi:hypothetical protein